MNLFHTRIGGLPLAKVIFGNSWEILYLEIFALLHQSLVQGIESGFAEKNLKLSKKKIQPSKWLGDYK